MSATITKNGAQGRSWQLPALPHSLSALESLLAQPLGVVLFAPLALLARPNTRRILLAILLLDVPLQVGMHFWNRQEISDLGGLGGLNVSVTSIALVLLYLSTAVEYIVSTGRRRLSIRSSRPLCLYVGIAAVSVIFAQDATLTFFEVALFVQTLLLLVYVANWITSREDVLFVVKFLLIGLVMESVLMIWLAQRGAGLELQGMRTRVDIDSDVTGLTRVGGSIGSPNGAGAYLSVLLSVAAGTLVSSVSSRKKLLAAVAFAVGAFALVMTYSRGGFISFLVGMGLVFLVSAARSPAARKWIVVGFFALASVVLISRSSLETRVLGEDAGAAYSRVPLMRLAFSIIAEHPVVGVGANNFVAVMDGYATGEFRHQFFYTVHNKYLLIWAETGLVGLLAYLWFLFSILHRGWQAWRMQDRVLSPIVLGLTAGLCGHMVQMLVDAFRGRPITQLIWLLAGVIIAIHACLREPKQSQA